MRVRARVCVNESKRGEKNSMKRECAYQYTVHATAFIKVCAG